MDFSFLPSKKDYDGHNDFQAGPYVKEKCEYEHVPQLLHLEDKLNEVTHCSCSFCKDFLKNGAKIKTRNKRSRPCATYVAAQFVKCGLTHLLGVTRPQCQWKFQDKDRRSCYLQAFQILKSLSEGSMPTKGLLLKDDQRYQSNFANKYKHGEEDRAKLMVLTVCI